MNILVVNERLRPIGGTEVYVHRQARVLTDLGHEVVAVCAEDDEPGTDSPFARRYQIPALFSAALNTSFVQNAWRGGRALQDVLERHRPDACLLHILDAPIGVRILQALAPTLRFVHTPWTYCPAGTRWLRRSNQQCRAVQGIRCLQVTRREGCMVAPSGAPLAIRQALRRVGDMSLQAAYFRQSTLVCANSAYSADEVVRLTGRSDNVRVLSPPVVPSAATPRAPVSNRVLFAGRITREKGLSDLIRAIVGLPQVHLVVAGEGPERAKVASLAADLGVAPRVEWLGWVDQITVDIAIQNSSVVVMPSLWAETFGLTGIQAAMNRRPIVAYDSGGVRDWLTPEMGILVRAGDVVALAAAIDSLTRDPVLAARLGDAAYARAQSYLPERHGVSLELLLRDACSRWRAPG